MRQGVSDRLSSPGLSTASIAPSLTSTRADGTLCQGATNERGESPSILEGEAVGQCIRLCIGGKGQLARFDRRDDSPILGVDPLLELDRLFEPELLEVLSEPRD